MKTRKDAGHSHQKHIPKPRRNPRWGKEEETNIFAERVKLFRTGKLSEDDFRRFRLQHGAYGSRLQMDYSMVRIKVPGGEIFPVQLEKLASLSVEVGLTSREACGNTIRNVMCSPLAGVCPDEQFDSTVYSKAIARFFLRNPMCQNLPRKFKINFACCEKHGLVRIADIGLVPMTKDGSQGFRIYLGGGLGAASFIGYLLEEFTSEEKLLPTCLAVLDFLTEMGIEKIWQGIECGIS